MKLPASVRCWPLLWSPPLPTQRPSDRGGISQPGSGSCRSSTPVGARADLAVSASKVIAICVACSSDDIDRFAEALGAMWKILENLDRSETHDRTKVEGL